MIIRKAFLRISLARTAFALALGTECLKNKEDWREKEVWKIIRRQLSLMMKMKSLLKALFHFLFSNGRDFVPPLTIFIAGIVFQNLVSLTPWLVESFYSRTIYPRVVGVLSFVSRGFGFSVGEVLTCLVLLLASSGVALFCVGLARRRDGRRSLVMTWLRGGVWV